MIPVFNIQKLLLARRLRGLKPLAKAFGEIVSIMDATGETIHVPPDTPRWTYTVNFQESEESGPYQVTDLRMTAAEAKAKNLLTSGDPVSARMFGKDDVESMRKRMKIG